MSLDIQARDVHALDEVNVQDIALRDDRAIKRAHNLTDVDGDPALGPLVEAHRLVVRACVDPLLGPVGAHLRFAVQPAPVVADQCQQGLDVLAMIRRVRLEEEFSVVRLARRCSLS